MGLYERYELPRVVSCVCGGPAIEHQRRLVVPRASCQVPRARDRLRFRTERPQPLWHGRGRPSLASRREVVEAFAAPLRDLGPANFLYADGEALFAHGDRRHQDDGTVRPPGLWTLSRRCAAGGELASPGLRIETPGTPQEVVLFASVPLTDESWVSLSSGEVMVAVAGLTPAAR